MGVYVLEDGLRIGFGIFPEAPSDGFTDPETFMTGEFANKTKQQIQVGILFIFQLKQFTGHPCSESIDCIPPGFGNYQIFKKGKVYWAKVQASMIP